MKRRRGRRSDNGNTERAVKMRVVTLLECNPGTRTAFEGQPVFMVTVAHVDGSIETLSLDLRDTKNLVTDALITLSYFKNKFAKYLLNKYWRESDPYKRDNWDAPDGLHDLNE